MTGSDRMAEEAVMQALIEFIRAMAGRLSGSLTLRRKDNTLRVLQSPYRLRNSNKASEYDSNKSVSIRL